MSNERERIWKEALVANWGSIPACLGYRGKPRKPSIGITRLRGQM